MKKKPEDKAPRSQYTLYLGCTVPVRVLQYEISARKVAERLGAAGAIEAVACALVLERRVVPPTINYRVADRECDLDCVPNTARELPVRLLVSNSYGFLGHNASVVMAAV